MAASSSTTTLTPPDGLATDRSRNRSFILSALVCGLLFALPFLSVTIPPITDLPQQLAQIRLLGEAFGSDDETYRIQAWHPNKLGYLPLGLAWLVASPLAAGRLGLLMIGWLWIVAIHGLAWSTGRSTAAAALACLFFFSHLTYWGLLNALIGLPMFAAWFVLLDRLEPRSAGWRKGLPLTVVACLLYSAHVLWLAVGLLWLVVSGLLARLPIRALAWRLAWASPPLLAVAIWYPRLQRSGFVSETTWGRSPLGRLHPEWWLNSALGGLEGRVELILGLAVVFWLALGLLTLRSDTAEGKASSPPSIHRGLLAAGLLFVTLALCLPAVIQNTIFFASRWLPAGVVFLVLACPPPRRPNLVRSAVPYLLLTTLALATTTTWIDFESEDLHGLHESVAAVPPGGRILGLDFGRTSERIKGFPFYLLYAYAQVLHGGEVARSFANLGSSLVVFRDLPREFPWTDALDWRAQRVRRSDIEHFQHVLVFGGPERHAPFLADERLTPVTRDRPWRLYRVGP
ncbi:MAG: hypothetical protein AAF657_22165 [Acidobacteriota bacterium]